MIDGSNGFAAGAASISSNRSSKIAGSLSTSSNARCLVLKVLRHRAIEKFNQRIVISRHVQKAAGLLMEARVEPSSALQKSSSMVPIPPGKAIKPSDSSAMSALRSCMELTTRNSDKPRCATSLLTSALGITPVT